MFQNRRSPAQNPGQICCRHKRKVCHPNRWSAPGYPDTFQAFCPGLLCVWHWFLPEFPPHFFEPSPRFPILICISSYFPLPRNPHKSAPTFAGCSARVPFFLLPVRPPSFFESCLPENPFKNSVSSAASFSCLRLPPASNGGVKNGSRRYLRYLTSSGR